MLVRNNYNECITNLACSIRKYFGLDYKHNTLDYIDKILEEYNPKNVVTILCDGMGYNIMDRMLDKNSFLMKNRIKAITTVFPATTVAATTSIMTGLNPVESGMLGWDMYYKELDKIITVYSPGEAFRHSRGEPRGLQPRSGTRGFPREEPDPQECGACPRGDLSCEIGYRRLRRRH